MGTEELAPAATLVQVHVATNLPRKEASPLGAKIRLDEQVIAPIADAVREARVGNHRTISETHRDLPVRLPQRELVVVCGTGGAAKSELDLRRRDAVQCEESGAARRPMVWQVWADLRRQA